MKNIQEQRDRQLTEFLVNNAKTINVRDESNGLGWADILTRPCGSVDHSIIVRIIGA